MTRVTLRSPRSVLLALFVSMTVAACSDDSDGSKMDAGGGKTDVASGPEASTPDSLSADRAPAPVDSWVADALAADTPVADAPVADAPVADSGAADLATKDTSINDAPAVDTGSDTRPVDGGQGTLAPARARR